MLNVKKYCVIIVCMLLALHFNTLICVGVDFIEKTVRINDENAICDIKVTAQPNSMVQLMVLYEDGKTSLITDSTTTLENLLYLDQKNTDETGEAYFTFTAKEKNGVCKIRLKGNVSEMSVTTVENEIMPKESGALFAIIWNEHYDYGENLITSVALTLKNINTHGIDVMARVIKERLKYAADGRRAVFLDPDMYSMLFENAVDSIWLDSGAELMNDCLKSFFEAYYEIGGDVDYVISDFESTLSNWGFGNKSNHDRTVIEQKMLEITKNPLYEIQLKPLLSDRGYVFCEDEDKSELYDVAHWNNGTKNYLIWNGVMDEWLRYYWNMAVIEPIIARFPNVKYSNFDYETIDGWNQTYRYNHSVYLGGSRTKTGSHSSPVLYGGGFHNAWILDYKNELKRFSVNTPFTEITSMMNLLRNIFKADKERAIQPWVNSYHNDKFLNESPYYYELLYHTALYNPDPFLFFGPRYFATDDKEIGVSNANVMLEALSTINELIGKGERNPIQTSQMFDGQDYLLSGMETENRNLFRYTPNLFEPDSQLGDVLITDNGEELILKFRDQSVVFPGGKLIDAESSLVGYWIETPKGIIPSEVITLEERITGDFNASISFYHNRTGVTKNNFMSGEEYCAVLRYDNRQAVGQEINLIAAIYKENQLLTVFSNEISVSAGSSGQKEILIDAVPQEATHVRLLLWDSLSNASPLIDKTELIK